MGDIWYDRIQTLLRPSWSGSLKGDQERKLFPVLAKIRHWNNLSKELEGVQKKGK